MVKKVLKICGIATIILLILLLSILIYRNNKYPLKYKDEIEFYAEKYSISTSLVAGLVYAESGFDKNAVSKVGAMGLMQIMPSTANFVATSFKISNYQEENLLDIETNLEIGCCYLRYLFNKFHDTKTVLASFNAGEGNVVSWLKDSRYSPDGQCLHSTPYSSTNAYIDKILKAQSHYKKELKED